jgi:hypothetical protein
MAATVRRTFANFDDLWMINLKGATVGPAIAAMGSWRCGKAQRAGAQAPTADASGHVTYGVRANAVKGDVPK